jgi:peptide/nickel transport system permease protein
MRLRLARWLSRADLIGGAGLLAGVALLALLGPLLWPVDPLTGSMLSMFEPPSGSMLSMFEPPSGSIFSILGPPGIDAAGMLHPLGTDQIGRDLLARVIYGTRLSLAIVALAGALGSVLGTGLGLVAGYFGGVIDAVIMRLVDIQLAVPFILLILLVMAVVGPGIGNLVIVLGVTGWAIYARTARARALELRDLEFVEAARAIGASVPRILRHHLLPNLLAPQLVLLTLDLPRLVVLEASVGFLGLGVQPPTPTLGNLIGDGQSYMLNADWLVIAPGLVISALVVGFNLLGDGLARRAGPGA